MKTTHVLCIALASFLAACHREQPVAANVLARVGDETLTIEQFQAAAKERGVASDGKARRALLDELVSDMRAFELARQRGYDKDPEIIRQQRNAMIAKVREASGITTETPPPREQVIQDYYNQHAAEFMLPARAHAAVIKVKAGPRDSEDFRKSQRAKIEAAHLAAKAADADFGKLALTFSEDQDTRYTRGDLGWQIHLPESDHDPVLKTLFSLTTDAPLSEVVEEPGGWFFVKLLELQPATPKDFKKARGEIVAKVQREALTMRERLYGSVLQSVSAEVHAELLPPARDAPVSLAVRPPRLPSGP